MNSNRSFNVRSTGLYKKANTLFNKIGTKVAVIIQDSNGVVQGYVSHGLEDWPGLYEGVRCLGSQPHNFLRPDNFDTVADRNFRHALSYTLGVPTAPSSLGGSTTDSDETDRQVADMIASVMEPDNTTSNPGNQEAPTGSDGEESCHLSASQPSALESTAGYQSQYSANQRGVSAASYINPSPMHASSEQPSRGPEAIMRNRSDMASGAMVPWNSGSLAVNSQRKRLSCNSEEFKRQKNASKGRGGKRRRIITRSRGDTAFAMP